MSIQKRKLLTNSFFTSQFNFYPLTWMCHSRTINNKINSIAWKVPPHCIECNKISSFEKLLEKDESLSIHTRKLQSLATKMFKSYKNLSPAIIVDLLHVWQDNFIHNSYFAIPNVEGEYFASRQLLVTSY